MKQNKVHGNATIFIIFILSGVDHTHLNKKLKILPTKANILTPIQNKKQYKLLTHLNKNTKQSLNPGTTEEVYLHQKLLKECKTTSQLLTLVNQIQQAAPTTEKKKRTLPVLQRPEKRKQRDPEMSPLTLRRTYLPRNGGNTKRPPAHPATAATAAAAQAQPPNINIRFKIQTKEPATPSRIPRLTRFKPGFEETTEKELAAAFHRPPRTYKEDKPFYPWLPPEPYVNFHLNFKG